MANKQQVEHRPLPYEVECAKTVLRDLLKSDTLHQRDAIAVGVALRALTSPSMELRERMLVDATTPEQRNPTATTREWLNTRRAEFTHWRNGFMAGITAVLGHPTEVENDL